MASLLGAMAARRVGTLGGFGDYRAALGFFATPIFWVGLMLVLVFSVWLDWLPSFGMNTVGVDYTGWARLCRDGAASGAAGDDARAVLHGGLCAADAGVDAGGGGSQDFVRTARAKGVPEGRDAAAAQPCATRCCRSCTYAGIPGGAV